MRLTLFLLLAMFLPVSVPGGEGRYEDAVRVRRHLHAHPELSNREFKTQAYLKSELANAGFTDVREVAGTGLRVVYDTGKPGKTVAFRAELDALPLDEATGLPFASTVPGVFHGCGHDLHAGILFGAAQAIRTDPDLAGKYVFLFQPAEEGAPPGEKGGAKRMIEEGVLEDPKPDAIFALHGVDFLTVGQVGYRPGPLMAQSHRFTILVKGKGGHPATIPPERNPISVASEIIAGALGLTPRQETGEVLISFGQINAGTRENIVPEEVAMKGTIRSVDATAGGEAVSALTRWVKRSAAERGLQGDIEIEELYPPLVCDSNLTMRAVSTLSASGMETETVDPLKASEDFAYFAEKIPSTYLLLGVSEPNRYSGALHSPAYNPSEKAISQGIEIYLHLARMLNRPTPL